MFWSSFSCFFFACFFILLEFFFFNFAAMEIVKGNWGSLFDFEVDRSVPYYKPMNIDGVVRVMPSPEDVQEGVKE